MIRYLSFLVFLAVLVILAAPLAAYACKRLPARTLKFILGALIMILSVRTMYLARLAQD